MKRLIVMQRLTVLLEGITTFEYEDLDGPHTRIYDFTDRVHRGRRTVVVDDARDALSILEAPRPADGIGAGPDRQVRRNQWAINIQGWPVEDRLHPSDPAYVLSEAVLERLARITAVNEGFNGVSGGQPKYPEDYHLGGLIAGIEVSQPLVLPPTENLSAVAFFYIPVTITLISDPR